MTGPLRTGGVTVSVVSHGHGSMVRDLLDDLARHCDTSSIDVIVTLNVAEEFQADEGTDPFPVVTIRNETPHGFGANHDAAFERATGEFFCVMNPDVRIERDPFPPLIDALSDPTVGVVGPRVVSPTGETEDSGRAFPTIASLSVKLWRRVIRRRAPAPDYPIGDDAVAPDWIGGMCMVFRSSTFREIGGFDRRYFLYYEDVDLCWRLRRAGYGVLLDPRAVVIHGARRSSWHSPRFLRWHLTSLVRFLVTKART